MYIVKKKEINNTDMKNLNLQAIQEEIQDNYLDLKSGILDVYDFCGNISEKYFKDIDPLWGERTENDPYCDLMFSLMEINGIELY